MSIKTSGICGAIGGSSLKDDVERMARKMRVAEHAHFSCAHMDGSVGFVSLSTENDGCKVVKNEKGTIVAVINGELSNANELRQQLESQGHVFSSDLGHEALVHLFENFKTKPHAFRDIQGAFSFAIWDETTKKLMLGLDKMGMRALYFTLSNGNLLFASEMKALANHPDFVKKVNPDSVKLFFSYFYVPTEDTLLIGVKRILQANYRIFSFEEKPIRVGGGKYWHLDVTSAEKVDSSVLCEKVYSSILNSVKEKIRTAKSPVGISLSGGLDSGLLCTLLRKLDQEVIAFVVAMGDGEQNEARLVAKFNESKVEEIFVTGEDYAKNADKIAGILDEPLFEWALVPMFLIGQRARKKVGALFTGDGCDETFWGDPTVPRRWFDPFLAVAPTAIKRFADLVLTSKAISEKRMKPLFHGFSLDTIYERTAVSASNQFFIDAFRKCDPNDLQVEAQVSSPEGLASPIERCFREVGASDDLLRRYYASLTIDFVHGGAGVRSRENLYSYHGVNCIMPFMDERVVQLGYTIPSYLKQPTRYKTKYILRKMISRYNLLPKKIIVLPKRAVADTFDNWTRSRSLKGFMLNELDEGSRLGIVKKDFQRKVQNETISPGKSFGIVMFILWYRQFFMAD